VRNGAIVILSLFLSFCPLLLRANSLDSIELSIASLKGGEKILAVDQYCKKYFQTNPELSIMLAHKLIQMSDTSLSNKALGYKYIGIVNYYQGKYNIALSYYDTAFLMYAKARNYKGMAAVLNNQGIAYMEQGLYDKALDIQLKAYKINVKSKDPVNFSKNLINIANIYLAQKNYSKSLEYNRKALFHIEKKGEKQLLADVYNNLGASLSGLGLLQDAKKCYVKSLSIRIDIDDKNGIATCYANLGNADLKDNKVDQAIQYYEKAIHIFEQINNPRGLVSTLNFCAEAYLYSKNIEQCELLITRSLQIANEYNLREIKPDILKTYKMCLIVKGDYKRAYDVDEECRFLEDSLSNEQMQKQMANLDASYQAAEKELQLQKVTLEKERQMKKWSWIVAGLSIIILLFALLFTIYTTRNKQKNILLANQKTNVEVQLLRAQMNPHFIFNSLSSIQSFILQNKSNEADAFLSKFARLMRLVLHHSSESYVSLNEEIESISLYLDLEKQRFNNRFEYQIELDENIDDEIIKVPPMLMQPFVENALIHGLFPKDEKGCLLIYITQNDCCITVEIVDNGIGRVKSQMIKNENNNHKSVGLSLTRQRLAMLNQQTTDLYNVKIVDLYNSENQPEGTKVIINMPWVSA
jgi:tetratricopeptide (TPR) repeat protein